MSAVLGGYAIFVGALALVGWTFDIPRLTDWTNEGISMFPNAALCGIMGGLALWMLAWPSRGWKILTARLAAGVMVLIGGFTLLQHLTGWNLGVDTLLVVRNWGQRAAMAPMRIGVPASLAYTLLGISVFFATDARKRPFASALGMLCLAIAALSLTGYLFGADQLFGVARFTAISWLTGTVVGALSLGMMASVPEHGVMAALRRDDAGGLLLRRLIVPVVAVPLLLGWLRIVGERAELYDVAFGTAMRSLLEIFLFVGLLWWTARSISWHAAAAHKAQSRLVAIVESSDDAIISKSLEGVIESWNAGAEAIFGYSQSEAVGQHITLIIPPDRFSEETEILHRLRAGERIDHFETVRRRKDGSLIGISLSVSPVRNADGEIIGASKIARDVTDRKRIEEQLRAIVEATPDCVMIVDRDGLIKFINQAGVSIIEAASEQDIRNTRFFNLVEAEYRSDYIQRHRRVCNGERLTWEFEIIGRRGSRRWMETHAVPLPQPDGSMAMLSVTREVTSRKQMEQERESLLESERAARSEAERASRLKDEFLATLSHELRTPLNAVLGWSQLLSMGSSEEELQEGLDAIQRNARAQAQLIEDLLDMSRIISGKVRLEVQPLELATVIESAIASITPAADAKKIRLRKVLDSRPGQINGDPTRLQQVVWNLLSNAVKFTPRNGSVDVILTRVNSHVEIAIHDSGIGIAPEHVPVVFERFRQVDSSTTRSHSGLGLGLSIVKNLVELHGGTVRAESAGENRGATFIVSLPLAPLRERESNDASSTILTPPTNHFHTDLQGVKVLVVDDEPDARALIRRLLVQCGAEVRLAPSAMAGLDELKSFRPDVLVSDIGMPGTDGYQFIKEVRNLRADEGGSTPAIALTAFARTDDRMRAMMAGFQVHVAKPVEPQELAVTIATLNRRLRGPSAT